MATLTVKNIPDELYQHLKVAAQLHRRSLNSEIIHCLESVLTPVRLTTAERIQRAKRLRARIPADVVRDG